MQGDEAESKVVKADALIRTLARLLVDGRVNHRSMEALARGSGETVWTLRYHYGNPARIMRATGLFLVEAIEARLHYVDDQAATVLRALEDCALFFGDLMSGRHYRDLMAFVSAYHRQEPWLANVYLRRVLKRCCEIAKSAVADAGNRQGLIVVLPDEAALRLIKTLELRGAVETLLPSPKVEWRDEGDEAFKRDLAKRIYRETYTIG